MSEYIEKDCTIEHNGRTFEAGGSYIVGDVALVYVSKREGENFRCTDWHGKTLGAVLTHKVGAWRYPPRGIPYRMAYVRVSMNGREWWGRYNCENGQAVRLRAVK